MSQRERQATGATKKAGRPAGAALAAARPGVNGGEFDSLTAWDDLFAHASAAEQADLLEMARKQGVLYSYQLPRKTNGAAAPVERSRRLVTHVLEGATNELDPVHDLDFSLVDAGLDDVQRLAVARALGSPDIFLLRGLPGTGKTRVVVEIILQAVARGERVLLAAARASTLDHLVERLGAQPEIFALRCLGREESPEALPDSLRPFCFRERCRAFREETLESTRRAAADLDAQIERAEGVKPLWVELAAVVERREQVRAEVERLQSRRCQVGAEVEHAAQGVTDFPALSETSTNGFANPLANIAFREEMVRLVQTRQARRSEHDAADATLHDRVATLHGVETDLMPRLDLVRPLAEAKTHGRWWSSTWWKAALRGDVIGDFTQLEQALDNVRGDLAGVESQLRARLLDRENDEAAFAAERARLIETEIAARRADLDAQLAVLLRQERSLLEAGDALCGQAQGAFHLNDFTAAGLEAARRHFDAETTRRRDARRVTGQWLAYLEATAADLAQRLPGWFNLVAATTAALIADDQNGERSALSEPFDLLVLEEADRATDVDFHRAARRAKRWVLVGDVPVGPKLAGVAGPTPTTETASRAPRAGARPLTPLDADFFTHLWSHLHCEPWQRRDGRLHYHRRPRTSHPQQVLECEGVADSPDIELRILSLPGQLPELVEVIFPPTTPWERAKQFIFRELGEIAVWAAGNVPHWEEGDDRLTLHVADAAGDRLTPIELEPGVVEFGVASPGSTDDAPSEALGLHTCRIEFDRRAGWQRERAERWIQEHLVQRDLRRTIHLVRPHRTTDDLARFLSGLYPVPSFRWRELPAPRPAAAPPVTVSETAVEFISVPSLKAPLRPKELRNGGGLEVDLQDSRHRDRLPTEIRAALPERGLVNYLEAQAIIRSLERLAAVPETEKAAPSVALVSLFPAQVALLRLLIARSSTLTASAWKITVDQPAALRHSEFAWVFLSLTRSHAHRATAYSDDPLDLPLAMTRARERLFIAGDVGALARRVHWDGSLDNLNESRALLERRLLAPLLDYLFGRGPHPSVFRCREGAGGT